MVKEGDLFLYSDALGHVPGSENSVLGLYYHDTRYLSRLELTIAGRMPVLLSSNAERGYAANVELTNLEARMPDGRTLSQATVHVRRSRFLADRLYESLVVRNYNHTTVDLVLDLHFDADFADLFEVRGLRRRKRGTRFAPKADGDTLTLAYLGLDDVLRKTVITFEEPPESIKQGRVRYRLRLAPGERTLIHYDVRVVAPDGPEGTDGDPRTKLSAVRHDHERWQAGATDIITDNEQVNAVLRRGQADLRMLAAPVDGETLPLAGLPWFAAPFGRELLMVGLETLLLDLRWSQAAVRYLSRHQGRHDSAFRDEQPGKIMHELRRGELANLHAIPHTPYFGSVDATPLYLLLVSELTLWTGDLDGFDVLRDSVDGRARLAGGRRRPRRRRLRRVPAPLARRPREPGLARRQRRDPARRRRAGARPSRARRDAGLRVLRQSGASPPSTASSATWSAPNA